MNTPTLSIAIVLGCITNQTVGAVVNTCNEFLRPNKGNVCIGIHNAAGSLLSDAVFEAAKDYFINAGEVPIGVAIVTPGFNLNVPIVHVVAPRGNDLPKLRAAYLAAFNALAGMEIPSAALPLIGTGMGGADPLVSAQAAEEALAEFAATYDGEGTLPTLLLVVKDEAIYKALREAKGGALVQAPLQEALSA